MPLLASLALVVLAAGCREELPTARADLVQKLYDGRDHIRIEGARELGKNANRLEAAELARAARGASIPVRREFATALGEAKAREAVDYLGSFTRDPDDSVRAAAVLALGRRSEPKARGYILATYARGGPESRSAIASLGPEILIEAVKDEAQSRIDQYTRPRRADGCCAWKRDHEDGCGSCPPQVRADALLQLGLHGTPNASAELALRLLDRSPLYASAAAEALGLARATEHADALLEAVGSGRGDVAAAAGLALARLNIDSAADSIAALLPASTPERASVLLDALEYLPISDDAREPLCDTARTSLVPEIAVRALLLVGESCELEAGPIPEDEGDELRSRMEVLALAQVSDAQWLARARELLTNGDARLAATAAHYLGAVGTAEDGERLLEVAEAERLELVRARIAENRRREELRFRARPPLAGLSQLSALFPDMKEEVEAQQERQKANALLELLRERDRASGDQAPEHRPGAISLVRAAAIGAARRGVDASELGARLLDNEDARLRQTAVVVADLLGEDGDDLREAIANDEDEDVRISMAIADLSSKRPGSIRRLTTLLSDSTDAGRRRRILEALAPVASQVTDALVEAATKSDTATPLALHLLASLDEPLDPRLVDITQAHLADSRGFGAAEALSLLERLEGEDAIQVLGRATVHPLGSVRERALDLLAQRNACPSSAAALQHDFERRVREAAVRASEVCAELQAQ